MPSAGIAAIRSWTRFFDLLEILRSVRGKLRPQEAAGMLPGCAVLGEDAAAEEWVEGGSSQAETVVVEIRQQNGFNIFRLNGADAA